MIRMPNIDLYELLLCHLHFDEQRTQETILKISTEILYCCKSIIARTAAYFFFKVQILLNKSKATSNI